MAACHCFHSKTPKSFTLKFRMTYFNQDPQGYNPFQIGGTSAAVFPAPVYIFIHDLWDRMQAFFLCLLFAFHCSSSPFFLLLLLHGYQQSTALWCISSPSVLVPQNVSIVIVHSQCSSLEATPVYLLLRETDVTYFCQSSASNRCSPSDRLRGPSVLAPVSDNYTNRRKAISLST